MKGMTLNDVAERKVQWLGFAFAVISAIAFFVLTLCTPALAEGTFIGEGAQKLLTDFAKVIALVGVGAGIFQVVKGKQACFPEFCVQNRYGYRSRGSRCNSLFLLCSSRQARWHW